MPKVMSDEDAPIFKRLVTDQRSRSDVPGQTDPLMIDTGVLRGYEVILDSILAPATFDFINNKVVLGMTTGTLWSRDLQANEGNSQDPANSTTANLIPRRDSSNACIRVRVFNDTIQSFAACTLIKGRQDQWGDLYVTTAVADAMVVIPTPTTTSPTSTTSSPNPCAGVCQWTWSAANQVWSQTSNGCTVATTTTTTTTTSTTTTTTSSGSTTTTLDPCICGTTPAPGSTTTTTLNPITGCDCSYPTFCGINDGDCTQTYCMPGSTSVSGDIKCTTTYNPSSTSSTTCDCNTTTTASVSTTSNPNPGCTKGCSWYQGILQGWLLVSSDCSINCPCVAPPPSGATCITYHTPCVNVVTTTQAPFCIGSCGWLWDDTDGRWVNISQNCRKSTSIPACICVAPSVPGQACSPQAFTGCFVPTNSTTTTLIPTTQPPCWQCSTTTTTANPCGTNCIWKWNGTFWVQQSSTCGGPCYCIKPPYNGTSTCQLVGQLCQTTTTTTTSTTSSTSSTTTSTTTTSTTTTTVDCLTYNCKYTWDGTSIYLYSNCDSPIGTSCTCPVPANVCVPCNIAGLVGSQFLWPCNAPNCQSYGAGTTCPPGYVCSPSFPALCTTTTTTTTTSTTTTTTSTTTSTSTTSITCSSVPGIISVLVHTPGGTDETFSAIVSGSTWTGSSLACGGTIGCTIQCVGTTMMVMIGCSTGGGTVGTCNFTIGTHGGSCTFTWAAGSNCCQVNGTATITVSW